MPIATRHLSYRRHRSRQGYVLIMTLVLIAIAALASAGLARRSLLSAQQAIEAQDDLQRHWGARSCQKLLLENAGAIFQQMEERDSTDQPRSPLPAVLSFTITLGGMEHHLWLSDENAKLNLNTVTSRIPAKRRQLLFELVEHSASLQLRPDRSPEAIRSKQWFSSWGQVTSLPAVWQAGSLEPLLQTTREITCWGNGKLNIRTASDDLLLQLVSQVLSRDAATELLDARSQNTDLELSELLTSLALRRSQQTTLRRWLTDESSCYSLWLQLEDRHRRWYYQWIAGDRSSVGANSTISFRW